MRRQEEEIKRKIVDGRKRGVCDKDGNTIVRTMMGVGHLARGLCPFGEQKLHVWPRDSLGRLVGDE